MTPKAPAFDEIEKFLKIDGWTEVTGSAGHGTSHRVFEKVLEGGQVLTTHISHSGSKSPGPNRFGEILREQLKITRRQFWDALHSGDAVDRPAPVEEQVPAPEAWQVPILLHQVGLSPDELHGMSPDEAQKVITAHWASPPDDP
jgi:hypothetical protein